MVQRTDSNEYKIEIDGSWSLADFYELPRVFEQVYAFHFAFLHGVQARDSDRLLYSFEAYPWQGGYSAVGFYNSLSSQIPKRLRPQVKSIRYASPGYITLGLVATAAFSIGRVVNSIVKSGGQINQLYGDIHKGLHERKLLRIEAERQEIALSKEKINFILEANDTLAKSLGFRGLAELNSRTGNPLTSLKILLSYYRRIRTLAEYSIKGKAKFPEV